MVKKLTKSGNSLALVFDKPILELLNITADTPLKITTNGRSLCLTPTPTEVPDEVFKAVADRVFAKHDRMLKRLAE